MDLRIHPYYDIIIVGAGIAGIYCASVLAEKYPNKTICIAEKYKMMGGRLHTYRPKAPAPPDLQWESGAGRVHSSHGRAHALLKKYGLTTVKIDSAMSYKASPAAPLEKNIFESAIIPILLSPLTRLSESVLANNTLENILRKIIGVEDTTRLLSHFPYLV